MLHSLALLLRQGAYGKTHHLINLGGVVLLNIPEDADVIAAHKVDGNTLATVPPGAANAVDVQLTVVGQVVVDHQGHLRREHTTTTVMSCPVKRLQAHMLRHLQCEISRIRTITLIPGQLSPVNPTTR